MRVRRSLLDMGAKSAVPDRAVRNFIIAHLPRDKFAVVTQAVLNDNAEMTDQKEATMLEDLFEMMRIAEHTYDADSVGVRLETSAMAAAS